MLNNTPSLRARRFEKQPHWQELMAPELARRLGTGPDDARDPRPRALAAAAPACLDTAATGWVSCDGEVPLPVMPDRAMAVLGE
ncbi:hypothetical protein ACFZCL_30405 [Streptomyces sp. NPDC008159]|uniref:acyl-CoA-like ligand-binding transcription factor n=1 Tax=Streptomyces sp. NPDC008159 TaxID=3364817 RepID=UPI0036E1578E